MYWSGFRLVVLACLGCVFRWFATAGAWRWSGRLSLLGDYRDGVIGVAMGRFGVTVVYTWPFGVRGGGVLELDCMCGLGRVMYCDPRKQLFCSNW